MVNWHQGLGATGLVQQMVSNRTLAAIMMTAIIDSTCGFGMGKRLPLVVTNKIVTTLLAFILYLW